MRKQKQDEINHKAELAQEQEETAKKQQQYESMRLNYEDMIRKRDAAEANWAEIARELVGVRPSSQSCPSRAARAVQT